MTNPQTIAVLNDFKRGENFNAMRFMDIVMKLADKPRASDGPKPKKE